MAALLEMVLPSLAFAGFILLIGLVVLVRVGHDNPGWWVGGRIFLAWIVSGIVISGLYQTYLNVHACGFCVFGMELFGLLLGTMIGAVHAGVFTDAPEKGTNLYLPPGYGDRLAHRLRPEAESPPGIQRGDSFTPPGEEYP